MIKLKLKVFSSQGGGEPRASIQEGSNLFGLESAPCSLQLQEIGLCNQHSLMKSAILKHAEHNHLTEKPKQEDNENVAKYL